jgi:iron-sulfur cluster assembly accessory protein
MAVPARAVHAPATFGLRSGRGLAATPAPAATARRPTSFPLCLAPAMSLPEPDVSEPMVAPPRIHVTSAAVERIREMLEEEALLDEGGLRLTAHTGAGCSAPLRFGMVLELAPEEDDLVLEGAGMRIFLDPTSAWALDGLQVDWVDSPGFGEGFAFRHPRGVGGRAC